MVRRAYMHIARTEHHVCRQSALTCFRDFVRGSLRDAGVFFNRSLRELPSILQAVLMPQAGT